MAKKNSSATEKLETYVATARAQVAKEENAKTSENGNNSFEKSRLFKRLGFIISLVIIIALAGTSYYFYHKYRTLSAVEADDIAAKIGKFMDLPSEKATLATVTDKDKVKMQPFFAKAENGDKVLIYAGAQKALLYRPSIGKLIEVMNLSTEGQDNSATQQTSLNQPIQAKPAEATPAVSEAAGKVKVAVYNGSKINGLASTLADKIANVAGVEIGEKTNAKGNFTKTIVIDLTGKNEQQAAQVAVAVGGEVGEMPEGETKPEADILVIGGGK